MQAEKRLVRISQQSIIELIINTIGDDCCVIYGSVICLFRVIGSFSSFKMVNNAHNQ